MAASSFCSKPDEHPNVPGWLPHLLAIAHDGPAETINLAPGLDLQGPFFGYGREDPGAQPQ